ncbi:hypothetical protein [Oleiharenicola lentus]|uniref:hypothetical protein n=1 Tax=Oleiharenicola lentus TaxID=2508720 RepID=UPI003F661C7D
MSSTPALSLKFVSYPASAEPGEITAAQELAKFTGARVAVGPISGAVVNVSLASRGVPAKLPSKAKDASAWTWIRIGEDGSGEIVATHGAFLFAAARLLATGTSDFTREKLAAGLYLPATFSFHRPLFDGCLTQYWRSARNFDPARYLASLAEAGFTHCEVNGLQAHMPMEDFVAFEYYPQFYTYVPGFNHFVDTELTKGTWPAHYLDANLNNLVKLANLGRTYGLKPGVCMFEPRTLPERFFTKYPTLRGARVDHPFRSRLPRYTMAQDHPITMRHYREALQKIMRSVPDLSYMSVWTNDSGSGFEHTSSLYVGRNGGPYMIREWRNHDKIAQAAGESILRYLKNLQGAAAQINPDFDVILRLEPFKVEQDHIKSGMGKHITWEAPSLTVRGYHVPYSHPRYPENQAVAGSIFHTTMDQANERAALAATRELGAEPVLTYAATGVQNHEPLLGLPFPRSIHQKLLAVRETGITRTSAMGGLANSPQAPYWPNSIAIRAAQFFPEKPIEDVLTDYATSLVGSAHATDLSNAWKTFEEALMWQPLVPLFGSMGFVWQRTWDRPIVPDLEAVPAAEREYYERHGCFQNNNPGLVDLGKDVLFDLVTQQSGTKMAADMDQHVIARLRPLIEQIDQLAKSTHGEASVVFTDLRDRVRAYLHWVTSLRTVCSWCENVYGYIGAKTDAEKATFEKNLQASIDLELTNTRGLIELLETTKSEVLVLSGIGETTFLYGENLVDHLKTKLRLTEKYRHHKPRIDADIYWRAIPGTEWPKGWSASAAPVK